MGLTPDTAYYFAIKATDDRGNVSDLSNVASAEALDVIPPDAVADLAASTGSLNGTIRLSWTAVGDSGAEGRASAYDIRYSTEPIDATNIETANTFLYGLTPKLPGQAEQVTVSSLDNEEEYFFAIRVTDDAGNTSGSSNVASASTPDVLPARTSSLAVTDVGVGELMLRWPASGDDGIVGIAQSTTSATLLRPSQKRIGRLRKQRLANLCLRRTARFRP